MVDDFLLEYLTGEGLLSVESFIKNETIFGILCEKGLNEKAISFWTFAERRNKNLAALAIKLLNIPASSAQIERLFSNWTFIHSDLRNRLELEKSKKLVNVYFTLKQKSIPNVFDEVEETDDNQ